MKSSYSKPLAKAYKAVLKKHKIAYSFDKNNGSFAFPMYLAQGVIKKLSYRINLIPDMAFIIAESPLGIDPKKQSQLQAMLEFIARVNHIERYGHFDLDCDRGLVAFRVFVDGEDGIPSEESIRRSILYPGTMFELFSEAIVDIILGADVKTAFGCALRSYCQQVRGFMRDDALADMLKQEAQMDGFREEILDFAEHVASLSEDFFDE